MSGFPGSPRLVKGGIVQVDPASGAVRRVIPLQYNPDTLNRSFQIAAAREGGDRSEALRLSGPPAETIRCDVELDAADALAEGSAPATDVGLYPQIAVLETLVYPTNAALQATISQAALGTLEIVPMESDLTLFVWSRNRVLPVRITELSVTEEAFDPNLNPIRARVSLSMRVLTVADLPFGHKGAGLFMAYHQQKERLAGMTTGALTALGLGAIP
ncbi:MAG: hypothetical protein GC151_07755 [Betaproteobacteria bacterium]|nr:hypothetical protein [Betaproteobacteria bacterium]